MDTQQDSSLLDMIWLGAAVRWFVVDWSVDELQNKSGQCHLMMTIITVN